MSRQGIGASELIVNPDGSIFHLHLHPEQVADTVVLVGDPGRVDTVAGHFTRVDARVSNREFRTVTGWFNGQRISVVSTGIGTDNIDIVLNELDALANIDLQRREVQAHRRSLTLVRLGTSGAVQADIPVDSFVVTGTAIGFDGLLNFYGGRDRASDGPMEEAFCAHAGWSPQLARPYFARSSAELVALFRDIAMEGLTISAPGFYGPQGRTLRLPLAHPELSARIESFRYGGQRITNFEMESSAINGLSLLLGHRAVTICSIIANRVTLQASASYGLSMRKLIEAALTRLTAA